MRCAGLPILALVCLLTLSAAAADEPAGEQVSTPEERARRIISMSPPVTEILFAIGAEERVVGVTEFCLWPEAARDLPKVGGYIDPNFERILSLRPDLVVIQGSHEKMREFAQAHRIALASVPLEGVEGILSGIALLGEDVGAPRWEMLVEAMRRDLAKLREAAPTASDRPSVFVSIGRTPGSLGTLFSAGPGSFIDELLLYAGGANALQNVELLYPQVSKEALLKIEPDVILEIPGQEANAVQAEALKADWEILGSVPAVKNGRIHVLTEDFLLVPGPRLVQSAARLREALHPGAEPVELETAPLELPAETESAAP